MKTTLTILLLSLCLYVYPQYTSDIYESKYYEEYIYDASVKEYSLTETSCDSIEIEIDTIYNSILFIQKVDSIVYLKREFYINNFDYNKEEDMYYFFVKETDIPEKYCREHIIYFSVPDSLITIVLENCYSICYFIDNKKP